MATDKKEAKRVEVTLKKDHTHGGKEKKAGNKIAVTEAQAAWLKKHEVA